MATQASEHPHAKRPGRWWRRWVITCLVWAVPVVALGVKEMVAEMLYDSADLSASLERWTIPSAQLALPGAAHCVGTLEAARAAGCPASIVESNAALHDSASAELHVRRMAQITGFFQAVFVYWVIPCAFILAVGLVCGLIRRSLRRPPTPRPAAPIATVGRASPGDRPGS